MKYTFGKNEKLKQKKMIDEVFKSKKNVFKYPFKILFLGEKNQNPPKILISVPKRSFKHAVDRNLLKRRIREAYRLNKYILQKSEIIDFAENKQNNVPENLEKSHFFVCESLAIVYVAKDILESKEIHRKMIFLLKEINKNSKS